MKLYYLFLNLLFLILFSSCFGNFDERDKMSRAILEDVAVWFIEEGLSEYYKNKDLNFLEKSIKHRGAYLYTEICIEKYGYLAHIVPELFWVRSTVTCYSRIHNNFIYEYWVMDRFGGTRTDVDREIYFIITKTEGMDKKREIIHRRAKFFSEFNTPEGGIVQFPKDNKSVYRLRPWKYSEAFRDTELEGIKVVINENKEYVRKKIEQKNK